MTKEYCPNVMVIKLLPPYENVVVGAFITTSFAPSTTANKVIGNGEMFCFSLEGSSGTKFEWAGLLIFFICTVYFLILFYKRKQN
jgi:hypothetical protein